MKVKCTNCGSKQDAEQIKAMLKAGFELRHLECRECGQQELKEEVKK